ncbi:MAG TPA: type II secretion system protein [Candidatus Hydrogenedens sp.]|nr:type II secretion system protein [Candidatus Hydrogenedens sp.]HOL19453.1 type II secretion system protein [Candidatus Hydrogenedens sp.]HPP58165.1 type II secretion system protein [Candidatus Hydrogenedens sp.]
MHSPRGMKGFTLLELGIVIFIIALMATIAVPYLLPLALSSELESEARKLAYFGRAVMSLSALQGDEFYVEIDLAEQRYYCLRITYPEVTEGETDQLGLLEEMKQQGLSSEELAEMLMSGGNNVAGTATNTNKNLPGGFDPTAASQQINQKFDKMVRKKLIEQAKNVKQEDSMLDEIGSLFDEKNEVDLFGSEPIVEEVNEPGLSPMRLSENVWIESVFISGKKFSKEVVEIQVTPLGLTEPVVFYLTNNNGEYYTVVWDPVSSGSFVMEGMQ